jgi:hypothetical protein
MEPEFDVPQQSSVPPSPAAALAPTLAVVVMAGAALAAAVMASRPDEPAFEYRAATPPPQREVVRAPPLNSMGAGPACRTCGVVESVAAVRNAKGFQMRIRMDDGSVRTVEQRGAMPAGTRVVVDGTTVKLMPGPGQASAT